MKTQFRTFASIVITSSVLFMSQAHADVLYGRQVGDVATDSSGQIKVAIFEASGAPTPGTGHFEKEITVGTEFVAIGGGFRGDFGTGQYLVTSKPHLNYANSHDHLSKWVIRAKDHAWGSTGNAYFYAIGLKVEGYTASQLKEKIGYIYHGGASGAEPYAKTSEFDLNTRVLVGGGSEITGNINMSQLLLGTAPTQDKYHFFGASKQHMWADSRSLQNYALTLPKNLIAGRTLSNQVIASHFITYNSDVISVTNNNGYVMTSCGAESSYNWANFMHMGQKSQSGAGKFITRMEPQRGNLCMTGYKDLAYADPYTRVRSVALGLRLD